MSCRYSSTNYEMLRLNNDDHGDQCGHSAKMVGRYLHSLIRFPLISLSNLQMQELDSIFTLSSALSRCTWFCSDVNVVVGGVSSGCPTSKCKIFTLSSAHYLSNFLTTGVNVQERERKRKIKEKGLNVRGKTGKGKGS